MIGVGDVPVGHDLTTDISTTGDAEAITPVIDVVQPHQMKSKAEQEAFMNELVEIEIDHDDEPNAPQFIYCGHGGTPQYVERGKPQVIKRRFLYALLAAKKKQFSCSFGKDGDGKEYNRLPGRSRPTHNLHVRRDDNPHGRQWFADVLAEA
jgi:hypothetical protein